jgi:uncharacterized SAM-binding protein YcdF (DUF218 family)
VDAEFLFRAVCRALVLPPGGPLLLGGLGLVLLRRAPRLGRALVATSLALILLLSVPVIADALTRTVETCPPLDLTHPPAADVIVVLGGGSRSATGVDGGRVPSDATLERLAYAATLARRTGLPLLLSGGAVNGEVPEAAVMQRALKDNFGLEARWLETRSRNTRENARYTAALLSSLWLPRALLVTSAVHMPRALGEFRDAGITVVAAPAPGTGPASYGLTSWLPRAGSLERSWTALYELGGQAVAGLHGSH